ncbi:hypothetical protein [Kocuria sp. KH4]
MARSPVPAPTDPDEFAALCRSSPWRWDSLRFVLSWLVPGDRAPHEPVRAWVRRPSELRVETLAGGPLYTATTLEGSRDDFYVASTSSSWLLAPSLVTPVFTDSGLVERRPEAAYGDPVFGGGRWQAILDPVELAGSAPVPPYLPERRPCTVEQLGTGVHHGRAVRGAVLTPGPAYAPATPGHPLAPARTRVLLDERTAVCVRSEVLEGPLAGTGHDLRIEAVDEYFVDDLFTSVRLDLTDVSRHLPWPVGP